MKFKNIDELMDKLNHEYKTLLDVIDNIILVIDNDFKILFINRKGRKLLDKDVLLQPCKILNTKNCDTDTCCIRRHLQGLEPLNTINQDGTVEKVTVSKLYDSSNKPQGFIIVATDITELLKIKKELVIGEEIYKLALTQANTTLWQYDVRNRTIEQLFCPNDSTLGILDVNKIYDNIPESLVEAKIISKEDGRRVKKLCQEIEHGLPATSIELKMQSSTGKKHWVSLKCSTIFDDLGMPVKSIGIGKDITDFIELKSKYEIDLEYREALGKDALSYIEVNLTTNEVIERKTAENNFIDFYEGKSYEKSILKLSENSLPSEYGKVLRELNRQNLLTNYYEGKRKLELEYQFYNKFKDKYNFIQITLYLIEFKNDIYACGYIKDIDENKVNDLVLKKKIELDPLTGLYNREAIEIKINEVIKNYPENKHVLMILDVDNFKQVNDQLGHLYGDTLLCDISRKLKSKFRNDDLVARLGGDEYLILMKNILNSERAIEKANEICKLIDGEYGTDNDKVRVTISVGVVLYPHHGNTFKELYHRGDQALYKIKKDNKNGVCLYDESMEKVILENQENVYTSNHLQRFSINITEHIFRNLYKSKNLTAALTETLELLGQQYNMSQNTIIVRDLKDGNYKVANFWKTNKELSKKCFEMRNSKEWQEYINKFNDDGILWIDNIASLNVPLNIKKIYGEHETKMVICSLIKIKANVIGVISLEFKKAYSYNGEKETLLTIMAIISTFVIQQYQESRLSNYLY